MSPDGQGARVRKVRLLQLRLLSVQKLACGGRRRKRAQVLPDGHQSDCRCQNAVPAKPAQQPGADRAGPARHQWRNGCLPASR